MTGRPVCITCSDLAVRMRVMEIGPDDLARCAADDGDEAAIDLGLVTPVAIGDVVLVHAGVALQRLEQAA